MCGGPVKQSEPKTADRPKQRPHASLASVSVCRTSLLARLQGLHCDLISAERGEAARDGGGAGATAPMHATSHRSAMGQYLASCSRMSRHMVPACCQQASSRDGAPGRSTAWNCSSHLSLSSTRQQNQGARCEVGSSLHSMSPRRASRADHRQTSHSVSSELKTLHGP